MTNNVAVPEGFIRVYVHTCKLQWCIILAIVIVGSVSVEYTNLIVSNTMRNSYQRFVCPFYRCTEFSSSSSTFFVKKLEWVANVTRIG